MFGWLLLCSVFLMYSTKAINVAVCHLPISFSTASMSRADSPSELPSPVDDDVDDEPVLNVGHFMMTLEGQLKGGV